jgi:REP element-mobilizing transposase RayT
MSIYIHKSHNVSVLIYHLVCPAKYRRAVFSEKVDQELKNVCIEISKRYEIHFLEIGTDKDHVHFLIQSVPMYAPTKVVRIVKSITAREIFIRAPEVKKQLWGGEFWSDGYYISSVGKNGLETAVQQYVKSQGNQQEYIQMHKDQLTIFI